MENFNKYKNTVKENETNKFYGSLGTDVYFLYIEEEFFRGRV